jgi:hypothetical protein
VIKGGIKGEIVIRINTIAAAYCRMSKTRQKKNGSALQRCRLPTVNNNWNA